MVVLNGMDWCIGDASSRRDDVKARISAWFHALASKIRQADPEAGGLHQYADRLYQRIQNGEEVIR